MLGAEHLHRRNSPVSEFEPDSDHLDFSENGVISSYQKTLDAAIGEIYADINFEEDPFYFIDAGSLRSNARFFLNRFLPGDPHAKVAYAVKANPQREILEIFRQEGIDCFDCATFREIAEVHRVAPDAEILFNHPMKKKKEVRAAAANFKVKHFTAQTEAEVEKILSLTGLFDALKPIEIAVRMRTTNLAAGIDLSPKFGAEVLRVQKMFRLIDETNLAPGISMHTGSQNTDPRTYIHAIDLIADVARGFGELTSINVGGGVPVNYFEEDRFRRSDYLKAINGALLRIRRENPQMLREDHKLIIEIGRAMVATSAALVVPILGSERRDGVEALYLTDGVYGSFTDYAVHGWQYNFEVLGEEPNNERSVPYMLYGPTCDSGDNLGIVHLPPGIDPEKHKLIVRNAGAYMHSQRTDFNFIDPPKVIIYNNF